MGGGIYPALKGLAITRMWWAWPRGSGHGAAGLVAAGPPRAAVRMRHGVLEQVQSRGTEWLAPFAVPLRSSAPRGRNEIAQGNALGQVGPPRHEP